MGILRPPDGYEYSRLPSRGPGDSLVSPLLAPLTEGAPGAAESSTVARPEAMEEDLTEQAEEAAVIRVSRSPAQPSPEEVRAHNVHHEPC